VFVPFTAQTRMSGVDLAGRKIRKGAADAIRRYRSRRRAARFPSSVQKNIVDAWPGAEARRW
jgi:K+-transporting ATPase ATPase B chain